MDHRLQAIALEIGEILSEAKRRLWPELYDALLKNNALSQEQADRLICCPTASIDRCLGMRQRAKSNVTLH